MLARGLHRISGARIAESSATDPDGPGPPVFTTLLGAAAFATRRLLGPDPWDAGVAEVLQRLGRAASVSRAFVIENRPGPDGPLPARTRCEWVAGANLPFLDPTPPAGAFVRWQELLASGGAIHGLTSELPEAERGALASQHVLSVVAVPVFAGEDWWGYLRLDDQRSEREWHEAEITILRIVADTIGAGLLRQENELAHREAEFTYRSLVEQIPMVSTYMDRVIVGEPGHSIPLYISPQIQDMLGYPVSEWLGEGELWLQVLHPDDAERMTREDEGARRDLRPLTAEYRMIARDGRVVWVGEKSAVVRDEETGTLYWQGVMIDITERKRIEEELVAARRKLLDQTVRAGEEERRRIAGDLHDGPVQRLTRLEYVLERARLQLARGDTSGPQDLVRRALEELATEIQRLRTMMTELRPPVLDHMGLGSALRDHADAVGRDSGVQCVVEATVDGRLDPSLETVLYRVGQQALANVVKHARADHAWLSLRCENGAVVLEIRDDGVGFDPPDASALAEQEHYGLIGMRERVEMAGGRWDITSAPGAGTMVRAVLPWKRQELP